MATETGTMAPPRAQFHRLFWLGLGVLAVGLTAVVALRLGVRSLSWEQVWQALVAFDPDSPDHIVVRQIRVPRIAATLLCGGCLGVAGALMQALTRNPLADPGLLGVNAGAALGVVLCTFVLRITDPAQFFWSALSGAALAAVLVFILGGNAPSRTGRLILAGAAVSALFFALIRGLLLVSRSSLEVYRVWVLGGFDNVTSDMVTALLPFIAIGLFLAFAAGFGLNALQLGEDTAQGLGVRVGLLQLLTGCAIVVLCAATVSMAGPIAFVGLIVPHLARATAPPDMRWLALFSGVYGATMLGVADIVARSAVFSGNMQAGVMSAILGGPVLIWLVRSKGVRKL
ncbi:iron ABC transporter permease [Phaeobacter sp. B1627]|uniref:FecCD family ABC transporter permease n=1 Tax=Phaeobacter sp. B1627 TaxID=2583809 RepID=UPI001118513C|nr:iron ABC transporter permease [Phaeobacter sp. B1627]TNJ47485.1 iron ABC transporter permease [Phaeobacter sp. B1627]